jgi:type I restriction enzyme S subunit
MNRREVKRAPVLRFKGFTNDWEQHTLGDFGSVAMNKRIFKNQTTDKGDVPFFKISTFGKKADSFISNNLFEKYKEKYPYPQKGDLLISASGSIGRIVEYKGQKAYYQDSNIVWLNHNKELLNIYLKAYYQIIHWHGIEGSTIKRLYNKNILATSIFVPDKKEQYELGKLIKKAEKIISLQQRKLKLLKEIRKGIVENIRDNNFEYKEQKNDFKDVKIKDMFKITRGKVLPKEKISSNKISPNIYPVFSSQTLNNGLLGFYKDYLFQNAITWTTDGANAGTVNFRNEKFYSTNVNGVLLQKKIKPDLLTADLLNLVAFKYVSKVGNPKLMNNTMANIRIKIPSNTNARIFYSKILNKYDTKIDFINKKIDYLTTFKRFLLQNMFI